MNQTEDTKTSCWFARKCFNIAPHEFPVILGYYDGAHWWEMLATEQGSGYLADDRWTHWRSIKVAPPPRVKTQADDDIIIAKGIVKRLVPDDYIRREWAHNLVLAGMVDERAAIDAIHKGQWWWDAPIELKSRVKTQSHETR